MIVTNKHGALLSINFLIATFALILGIAVLISQLNLNAKSSTAAELFEISKNSVVELKAESTVYGTAYGSAICIGDRRLITNAHVVVHSDEKCVEPYELIYIRTCIDDEYLPIVIVGYDINNDLCLLELNYECNQLKPLQINNNIDVKSGEKVFAVGNAMNHGIGITEGIVSIPLINVSVNKKEMNVIQCDITISSGSSGGALLNDRGDLVGITTFRIKDQNGYIVYGVGFALTLTTINTFLESF